MTSTPRHGQPVPWQTPDPNDERLAQLRRLVPEAGETIQRLRTAFGVVYDQLVAITDIHVPEIEQMLSA